MLLTGSGLTTLVSLIKKDVATKDYVNDIISGLTPGEMNVIEGVEVNGDSISPVNKIVAITIPVNVSELNNDAGFITAAQVDGQVQVDWAQEITTAVDYIKNKPENLVQDADYVHTDNNYTDSDSEKLAGIESGAQVNVKSDWNEVDSDSDAYILNKPNIDAITTTIAGLSSTLSALSTTVSGISVPVIDITAELFAMGTNIGTITVDGSTYTFKAPYIQSDWEQSDSTQLDYIKNKPDIPTASSFTSTYDSRYKSIQSNVVSPLVSGSTTAFIDTISQNTNGVISVTKKDIPTASSLTPGIMLLGASGGAAVYGHTHTLASDIDDGFMSHDDWSKLNGIESGAQVNVQSNWTENITTSDAYIQNKPSITYENNSLIISGF